MAYIINTTPFFNQDFQKIIPKQYHGDIKRRLKKLENNPFVGRPLGDRYFRELKLGKFRIYFIIFEKEVVVFVVAVSNKKTQKHTIDIIRERYPDIRDLVKNIKKNE